jgi:S-disulfanyl-L-cysteine oxidoreductase SoxD
MKPTHVTRSIVCAALLVTPTLAAAQARAIGEAATAATGLYTTNQAERGRVVFQRSCGMCHTADASPTPGPLAKGQGFWLGESRLKINLGGRYVQKYPTAYHLFRRLRDSMPPFNVDSVSPADKVSIAAYLLKASGLPAGHEPLPLDVNVLKSLSLEPGFERLFNGRNFDGIKFVLGMNCRPAPEGCGTTEPGSIFTVENGALSASGKVHGYWYPDAKYLNFTLRFDYRFERPVDLDPGDEWFDGNSGYMIFVQQHQVWPRAIELQGNHRTILSVAGMDTKVKVIDDDEARKRATRPVGQWNGIEVVSKDGQVKSFLNGILVSTIVEHEFRQPAYIGFQSEGAKIFWRNIRIRPE